MKPLDYLYRYVNKDLEGLDERNYQYEGINYPKDIFRVWTEEELNGVGIYKVEANTDIPEGKVAVAWEYKLEGEVAKATPILEDVPVYVPQQVSRAQGKAALILAGLYEDVQAYIDSLEGVEMEIAYIAFNETNTWDRDSEFLKNSAEALNLSEEDLDNLFIAAGNIQF